ncbi:hypothetical protein V1514DRAFT_274811 [Lipomyces japonicus]|uniref:uncharacterized protein n=1 Tax=Lipomyces japonicus TaxID=56871 RepID=UPI0034CE9015
MATTSWLNLYNGSGSALVKKSNGTVPDPAGFNKDIILNTKIKHGKEIVGQTPEERDTLKAKKAWEIALSPSKSLPMNAIMSYFSGSSLQIFSLTMTFMLFSNPVKAIASVSSTFARYESEGNSTRLLQAKLVFVALQLATIAVGVWKMGSMGVLPTERSDWLAWERASPSLENAVFIS